MYTERVIMKRKRGREGEQVKEKGKGERNSLSIDILWSEVFFLISKLNLTGVGIAIERKDWCSFLELEFY